VYMIIRLCIFQVRSRFRSRNLWCIAAIVLVGTAACSPLLLAQQGTTTDSSVRLTSSLNVRDGTLHITVENAGRLDEAVYLGFDLGNYFVAKPFSLELRDSKGTVTEFLPRNSAFVFGGRINDLFLPLLHGSKFTFILPVNTFENSVEVPENCFAPGAKLILRVREEQGRHCPDTLGDFHCWRGEAASPVISIE
jgi:hypothetical protein